MSKKSFTIDSFFKPTEAKKFVTDAPKVIECRFCVEKFASSQGLGNHVKAKHNTPKTRQHRSLFGTAKSIAGTLQVVSRVRHEQYLTFRIAGGTSLFGNGRKLRWMKY
jgi:hypothetical protein